MCTESKDLQGERSVGVTANGATSWGLCGQWLKLRGGQGGDEWWGRAVRGRDGKEAIEQGRSRGSQGVLSSSGCDRAGRADSIPTVRSESHSL